MALCKTTAQGTTAKNLRKAISTIDGTRNVEIAESRPEVALLRMLQAIYEGRPVIVAVENWEHYAVASGVLGFGQRINCVDSGDNDLHVVRTLDEFVAWWRGPEQAARPFWGVIV